MLLRTAVGKVERLLPTHCGPSTQRDIYVGFQSTTAVRRLA
jgi:hypothetical protein